MNYFSMNEVPIGTEVKIKNSDLIGRGFSFSNYF